MEINATVLNLCRLMVPRSVEHLVAVMDLVKKEEEFLVDLLQISGSTTHEGWILPDGKSTHKIVFQQIYTDRKEK